MNVGARILGWWCRGRIIGRRRGGRWGWVRLVRTRRMGTTRRMDAVLRACERSVLRRIQRRHYGDAEEASTPSEAGRGLDRWTPQDARGIARARGIYHQTKGHLRARRELEALS